MSEPDFVKASTLISSLDQIPGFPSDLFAPAESGSSFLDDIGFTEISSTDAPGSTTISITLAVKREIVFDLPGLSGFQLVLGKGDGFFELPLQAVLDTSGTTAPETVLDHVTITGMLAVRFPRSVLKPMVLSGTTWSEAPATEFREVVISTSVNIDTSGQISFGGAVTFDLDPAMVGDSGVIISAQDVELVLSDAAAPVGAPAGFRGVYIGTAQLAMQDPGFPVTGLSLEHAFIGKGGFSGDIDLDLTVTGSLAGFEFSLTHFGLTFQQNAITGSDIRGQVTVPFFDRPVDVALSLSADGSFSVALSSAAGLANLSIDGLLEMQLSSLEFGSKNGVAELGLGGTLKLDFDASIDLPSFEIKKLTINSRGEVTIEGGWIDLGDALSFDFYGFQMSLTRIGFGSEGDGAAKRNWIGLSGTIKLVDGLAIGGSVDGLKISWKADPSSGLDVQLSLDGIGVDLSIPDVLEFGGVVHFINDPATDTQGFAGDIHLTLPTLNFSGEASILVGRQGEMFFFYLAVTVDLPLGIPLGQSGVAFYGFQGLIGFNVYPNRTPDQAWYEDWYLFPEPGVTKAMKWFPPVKDAFAIGLGATLGTFPDNGFSVSGRVLVALVFPGPLLLIEGRANFLAGRGDLSSNDRSKPPFRALMVLDGREGTVLLNIGAVYEKEPLIKLAALAEAFFNFNDPTAWHLYLGVDEPHEKRVQAEVLDFLKAQAYWMLTAEDLRFGAWAGYDGNWSFGPLKVVLQAWVDGGARVGFDPIQIAGFLDLHGAVKLRAFGIGLGISVDARLEAEAPKPFHVKGDFDVELELPWPIPDVGATVTLEWEGPPEPPDFPNVIQSISLEHRLTFGSWKSDGGTSIPDNQPVPMDARPVISFARAVSDQVHFNGGAPTTPYAPETSGKFTFTHELKEVRIDDLTAGQPVAVSGTWKAAADNETAPAAKLELRGKNPFDYYGSSTTGYAQWIIDNLPSYPCGGDVSGKPTCQEFDTVKSGVLVTDPIDVGPLHVIPAPRESAVGGTLAVGPGATRNVLRLRETRALQVVMPGAVEDVDIAVQVGGRLTVRALKDGQPVGGKSLQSAPEIQHIEFGDLALDTLVFQAANVALVQICWLPQGTADAQSQQSILQQVTAESVDQWYSEEEIFKANHRYQVTVRTETTRSGPDGDDTHTQTASLIFRTAAPPALSPLVYWEERGESGSGNPYASLTPYVQETVPSDGQRPVYRTYDVGVNFNQNYVESMYTGDVRIRLFAPGDREVTTGTGLPSSWGRGRDHTLTEVDELWLEQLSTMDCVTVNVDYDHIITSTTLTTNDAGLLLDPELRHEARVMAAGVEAHRFSFVTSRYRNFAEHMASFDGHIWVEDIATPANSTLQTLVGSARAAGMTLDPAEAALFEQLYYDVLGLPQRELPRTVEWSEVRAPGGGVALLFSSPEPVDWRRVNLQVRKRLQSSTGPGLPGVPLNIYVAAETVWVRHADGTKALVFFPSTTAAAGPIPTGRLRVSYTFNRVSTALPTLSVAGNTSAESATHNLVLPAVTP